VVAAPHLIDRLINFDFTKVAVKFHSDKVVMRQFHGPFATGGLCVIAYAGYPRLFLSSLNCKIVLAPLFVYHILLFVDSPISALIYEISL
jgi:hypothetical protein